MKSAMFVCGAIVGFFLCFVLSVSCSGDQLRQIANLKNQIRHPMIDQHAPVADKEYQIVLSKSLGSVTAATLSDYEGNLFMVIDASPDHAMLWNHGNNLRWFKPQIGKGKNAIFNFGPNPNYLNNPLEIVEVTDKMPDVIVETAPVVASKDPH